MRAMRSMRLPVFILLACASSSAQWVQTSGPEGGYPMSFVSLGSTIFAGSFGEGVFKSTNAGDTWTWSGTGFPSGAQVRSLTSDGSILYAGTSSGHFYTLRQGASRQTRTMLLIK